jgi:hypothetical protein
MNDILAMLRCRSTGQIGNAILQVQLPKMAIWIQSKAAKNGNSEVHAVSM